MVIMARSYNQKRDINKQTQQKAAKSSSDLEMHYRYAPWYIESYSTRINSICLLREVNQKGKANTIIRYNRNIGDVVP